MTCEDLIKQVVKPFVKEVWERVLDRYIWGK